jgi:1-phosphofructokinase family hexose kinase
MKGLFVTVTLNPAIDRTITADRLVFDDRGYIQSRGESAGGRGLNASAVLHSWGAPTLAIVPSGGESGPRFEAHLAALGFPYEAVPVRQNVRSNLIITDRQGMTVKLNEPGPALSQDELAAIETAVRNRLAGATWLMICGSLPPGVPSSYVRRLIAAAREAGVKVLVDTDGEPLQDALLERPTAVTPNRTEAAALLNKSLITRQHFRAAAQRICEMGAEAALLSLGSRGVIGVRGAAVVEAVPPRIDAVCPIGAGDALNAAYVWALEKTGNFSEAVRWAVAAGTASAQLPGISFATLDQARAVYEQVELK